MKAWRVACLAVVLGAVAGVAFEATPAQVSQPIEGQGICRARAQGCKPGTLDLGGINCTGAPKDCENCGVPY
jgi:hypothetical protein